MTILLCKRDINKVNGLVKVLLHNSFYLIKGNSKELPASVDHINVFDGNTGEGFTVDNPEDIEYIVENIQSKTMRRGGISLGHIGYKFSVVFIDENDKAIVPIFFINSDRVIGKDPFFYRCDGGLCMDYLTELEHQIVGKKVQTTRNNLQTELGLLKSVII